MHATKINSCLLLSLLLLASPTQAQTQRGFSWNKVGISPEFSHNITPKYGYGFDHLLQNHPNNSMDIRLSYDLGHYFTLSAFFGGGLCYLYTEVVEPASNYFVGYEGELVTTTLVNKPWGLLGLQADLHLLPLVGVESEWYDIYVVARAGRTEQDLDLSLGLGFAYWPLKWLGLYANIGGGAIGFPYGHLNQAPIHYQTRIGLTFKL